MAQVTQHRARLHRRQLVLVPQQDQRRASGQRIEQAGHHFQVHHRCLVNDQHIDVERIAPVVCERARIGARTEQAVERARRAHARRQLAQRQVATDTIRQFTQGLVNRLLQARRRLARWCGQCHALAPCFRRRREQQGQQARHRVGLAGAGTARDDRHRTAQRHGAGELLPVGSLRASLRREQLVEPAAHERCIHRMRGRRTFAHGLRHQCLVAPVTPQVQALAIEHQRLVEIEFAADPDLLAVRQQLAPPCHAARQRRGRLRQLAPCIVAPAQQQRRSGREIVQLQAAVAMAFELGQHRRRQDQRGRCVAQLCNEARERARQATQLACFGQRADLAPQTIDIGVRLRHVHPCPASVPVHPAGRGPAPAPSSHA